MQHVWSTFQGLLGARSPQTRYHAVDLLHQTLRQARPTLPSHDLGAVRAAITTMAFAPRDQEYNGSTEASLRARVAAMALYDDAVLWTSLSNQSNLPGARNIQVHVHTDPDGGALGSPAVADNHQALDEQSRTATRAPSHPEIEPQQVPQASQAPSAQQASNAQAVPKTPSSRSVFTVDELADLNQHLPQRQVLEPTLSVQRATSRRSATTAATARTRQAAPPPSEVPTLGAGTVDATDSASGNIDPNDASGHGSSVMRSTLPSLPNVMSMSLSQAGADGISLSRALSQPLEGLPEGEVLRAHDGAHATQSSSHNRISLAATESGRLWGPLLAALDQWDTQGPLQPFAGRYMLGHYRKEGRRVLVVYAHNADDASCRYALRWVLVHMPSMHLTRCANRVASRVCCTVVAPLQLVTASHPSCLMLSQMLCIHVSTIAQIAAVSTLVW